jgi:hypothetical protein
MFIYQDGKLYVQDGDTLIGVEIYPDSVIKVEGTETELKEKHQLLTPFEVRCKFNIKSLGSYIFPVDTTVIVKKEVKETIGVDEDGRTDTVGESKKIARGRPAKRSK